MRESRDHARKSVVQTGRRPSNVDRQIDAEAPKIGLTTEAGGCARPNHTLTSVVTLIYQWRRYNHDHALSDVVMVTG